MLTAISCSTCCSIIVNNGIYFYLFTVSLYHPDLYIDCNSIIDRLIFVPVVICIVVVYNLV